MCHQRRATFCFEKHTSTRETDFAISGTLNICAPNLNHPAQIVLSRLQSQGGGSLTRWLWGGVRATHPCRTHRNYCCIGSVSPGMFNLFGRSPFFVGLTPGMATTWVSIACSSLPDLSHDVGQGNYIGSLLRSCSPGRRAEGPGTPTT